MFLLTPPRSQWVVFCSLFPLPSLQFGYLTVPITVFQRAISFQAFKARNKFINVVYENTKRSMKKYILCLCILFLAPTNRHLQDVGLNAHPIQNWRSKSNIEEVLGNAYPPFLSQSKDIPVTYINIQRKEIFCRSRFQVKFTLWNGLWECPSSWSNQNSRVCEDRGFA